MKMKYFFVLACIALTLKQAVLAAETPTVSPGIFAPAVNALKKSDALYEANIPAAELAKRERENVAANREALAQLRILMEKSPQGFPAPRYDVADEIEADSNVYSNLREFARLLIRESKVCLDEGDAVGAMQSRLDCYRLAVNISRNGIIIDGLKAVAVEAIAWKDIDQVGSQLDGKSCLEFFQQIENIKGNRATYVELLEKEKAHSLVQANKRFESVINQHKEISKEELARIKEEIQADEELSAEEKEDVLAFSPEKMVPNLAEAFDLVIAAAKQPFSSHAAPIKTKDAFSKININVVAQSRFNFERSDAATHLVQAALLLRARQLGAISEDEFERLLPPDPFSSGRLKVKSAIIYSVGPDGEDNGGEPFKNVWRRDSKTGEQTQAKPNILQTDSVGDVIAPNLLGGK